MNDGFPLRYSGDADVQEAADYGADDENDINEMKLLHG
jgi:hypothetical protein